MLAEMLAKDEHEKTKTVTQPDEGPCGIRRPFTGMDQEVLDAVRNKSQRKCHTQSLEDQRHWIVVLLRHRASALLRRRFVLR